MKPTFKTLALAFISSLLMSSLSLAQFIYPPASIFSPTANTFRGAKTEPIQWLETHDAQILAFLLSINQLESELNQPQTKMTLFVPQDEAFARLPSNLRQKLSQPEAMERLLKYHLVSGIISEADIENQQVSTVEGSKIKITGKNAANGAIETKLNEATVETSIGLNDNLVLIMIDEVLLPPNF